MICARPEFQGSPCVRIAPVLEVSTYAQAIEKALTIKSAEDAIWRESTVRHDVQRVVPPCTRLDRSRGPSDQKRKATNLFSTLGQYSE